MNIIEKSKYKIIIFFQMAHNMNIDSDKNNKWRVQKIVENSTMGSGPHPRSGEKSNFSETIWALFLKSEFSPLKITKNKKNDKTTFRQIFASSDSRFGRDMHNFNI